MKCLMSISMLLLIISMSCYAQEAQESYTLVILDFENKSGIENPLLATLNETIAFVLSRQTGPVQVHAIPTSDRDALLMRAAMMQPDATLLEQGLLAAERVGADALIAGSYTKQGEQWSLNAQVYHRRKGGKTLQEIQIQRNSLYKLLDEFPAQLLQQFTASYIALTTDSWKAYEEFRKGHQDFEYYNFFGALGRYDNALALDPTLALAYAEKSCAHATIGQREQATMAIEAARKLMSKASSMEQLAVRALDFTWDSEHNEPGTLFDLWDLYGVEHLPCPSFAWTAPIILAPGGVWDEPLIHQLVALACMQEGKREEADQHHQRWFKAMQPRLQAHPEDALLLHQTAAYCAGIGQYLDEAISMELKAIELNSEANWREERYILSRLYELKGDIEQSLEWAKRHIRHWPDPRSFPAEQTLSLALEGASFAIPGKHTYVWDHLAASMHKGKITPERLLRWCEDMLSIPDLHQPFRVRTQYLLADVHHAMNNDAKMEEVLTTIGAPRESDWMVIGPLDTSKLPLSPGAPPFAELFSDLTATHAGIFDQEMRWKPWRDEQPLDGLLNVWGVFNRKYYDKWLGFNFPISSIAYNCIYVKVPTAIEAQVRTGCAFIKVWLNDDPTPVIEVGTFRAPVLDQKVRDVSLAAGLNRFLVEMVSSNSMAFYFRITDSDGNPVPGLEFVSAKEVFISH